MPQADGSFATQLINPQSIYRMSFCEEAVARIAAKDHRSAPVSEWQVKHLLPPAAAAASDFNEEDDDPPGEDAQYPI